MEKNPRFLIRQRAFLKMIFIKEAQKAPFYGLQIKELIANTFSAYDYTPTNSEIYKSLHDLIEEEILKSTKKLKEDKTYQELVIYSIRDEDKAKAYLRAVKFDLDYSSNLIEKALKVYYT